MSILPWRIIVFAVAVGLTPVLASFQVSTSTVLQDEYLISPEDGENLRLIGFRAVVTGNDLGCGVVGIYTALIRGELANFGSKPVKGVMEVVFKDEDRDEVVAKKLVTFEVPARTLKQEVSGKIVFSMIVANRPGLPEVGAMGRLPIGESVSDTAGSGSMSLFKAFLLTSGLLKPVSHAEAPSERTPLVEGAV